MTTAIVTLCPCCNTPLDIEVREFLDFSFSADVYESSPIKLPMARCDTCKLLIILTDPPVIMPLLNVDVAALQPPLVESIPVTKLPTLFPHAVTESPC